MKTYYFYWQSSLSKPCTGSFDALSEDAAYDKVYCHDPFACNVYLDSVR